MYKGLQVQIEMMREASADKGPVITSPEDVWKLLSDLRKKDREYFVVICLNAKNRVLCINTVSIGSLTASIVHPREVFKPAILANAVSVIITHNHPSSDPEPSGEDKKITKQIAEAGEILGIRLLDHVIIGSNSWVSLKDRNLI